MHCAHTQARPGLGWSRQRAQTVAQAAAAPKWPEAVAPARAVGAQARGSDYCARLVTVQGYLMARLCVAAVGTDGGDGSGLLGAMALGHGYWLWTAHCKGG